MQAAYFSICPCPYDSWLRYFFRQASAWFRMHNNNPLPFEAGYRVKRFCLIKRHAWRLIRSIEQENQLFFMDIIC